MQQRRQKRKVGGRSKVIVIDKQDLFYHSLNKHSWFYRSTAVTTILGRGFAGIGNTACEMIDVPFLNRGLAYPCNVCRVLSVCRIYYDKFNGASLDKQNGWRQTTCYSACMRDWVIRSTQTYLTEIIRTSHQRRNGRSSGRWYHRLRCRGVSRSGQDEDHTQIWRLDVPGDKWMREIPIVVLKDCRMERLREEVVHVSFLKHVCDYTSS
jgi:hypothetical protein